MNWLEIDKVSIFTGKDENGNRYLSRFLKDYKSIFNPDVINAGCQRCLEDYYLKLTKHLSTMSKAKNESGYQLKEKYNGIPLSFGSPIQVDNNNITKEYAEKLLKDHPRGLDLFDVVPVSTDADVPDYSDQIAKLDRDGLDAEALKFGLVPDDYKNKSLITDAILEAKKSQESTDADVPEE